MTNTKHTPGPWTLEGGKVCGNGYYIATVNSHGTTEGRANATLIAAAPDLLEALQRMNNRGWFAQTVCASEEENADMAFARAVIAKAEGGAA